MNKLDILKKNLKKYNNLCIGFSGGVDSTFLLNVAYGELADNCTAVIADAPMLARRDFVDAVNTAKKIGVPLKVIKIDAISVSKFVENSKERCYYCKANIFGEIKRFADSIGAVTADGSNADDALTYRPGRKAILELEVASPLYEAGLTKQEIRGLSRELKLNTCDKPSNACLATRIPYGENISLELLNRIEQAEDYLYQKGIEGTRVRTYNENMARIESKESDFDKLCADKELITFFKNLGFKYVTLDLEGFRSGSMDL